MSNTDNLGIEVYTPWAVKLGEPLHLFLSKIKDNSSRFGVWVDPKNIDVGYQIGKVDANYSHLVCIGSLKELSFRAFRSPDTDNGINYEEILFSFRNKYDIDSLIYKAGRNTIKQRDNLIEILPDEVLDALRDAEDEFLSEKSVADAKAFVENEVPKIIEQAKKSRIWSNFIRKVSIYVSRSFKDEGVTGYKPSAWVFMDKNEDVMRLRDTIYLKRKTINNSGLKESIDALVKWLKKVDGSSVCCIYVESDGDGLWEVKIYDYAR